eukprot:scaffold82230_cov73-Phaeocystis_antarctica.AAC.1
MRPKKRPSKPTSALSSAAWCTLHTVAPGHVGPQPPVPRPPVPRVAALHRAVPPPAWPSGRRGRSASRW